MIKVRYIIFFVGLFLFCNCTNRGDIKSNKVAVDPLEDKNLKELYLNGELQHILDLANTNNSIELDWKRKQTSRQRL